jgi:CubicO group peptidase (beta-lactamase class C family)
MSLLVTKLVTAVTALRLVDRGVLRLDQPLTEVLAPEHRPRALTAEHTLHHLLSHTSGLANYHDDDDTTWASYTSCWDRVPGYLVTDEPAELWRANTYSVPAGGMPDGGLITTPHDLARLLDALLGGHLLESRTATAMTSPQGPPSGELEQYGYGCQLVVEDGEVTIIGHSGADPGVSALVSRYRAAATTIVVLCNYDRGAFPTTQYLARALGLRDPRA